MKNRLLRWCSIGVRGNWQWTLALSLIALAALLAGFSDGGDRAW